MGSECPETWMEVWVGSRAAFELQCVNPILWKLPGVYEGNFNKDS